MPQPRSWSGDFGSRPVPCVDVGDRELAADVRPLATGEPKSCFSAGENIFCAQFSSRLGRPESLAAGIPWAKARSAASPPRRPRRSERRCGRGNTASMPRRNRIRISDATSVDWRLRWNCKAFLQNASRFVIPSGRRGLPGEWGGAEVHEPPFSCGADSSVRRRLPRCGCVGLRRSAAGSLSGRQRRSGWRNGLNKVRVRGGLGGLSGELLRGDLQFPDLLAQHLEVGRRVADRVSRARAVSSRRSGQSPISSGTPRLRSSA